MEDRSDLWVNGTALSRRTSERFHRGASAIQDNLLHMTNFKPDNWPKTTLVTWIRKMTPPCKEVTRLLSQSMDRRLPIRKRLGIWLHFTICDFCMRYAKHLAFIRQASRSIPEHLAKISTARLPEVARERIRHKCNGAQC